MQSIFKLLVVLGPLALCGCAAENQPAVPTVAQPLPTVAHLTRTQATAGLPNAHIAVMIFGWYGLRGYGGMCAEQTWNGKRVYLCTTRSYLDPQPFGVELTAVRQPAGYCGVVGRVYLLGPHPDFCGTQQVTIGFGAGLTSGSGLTNQPYGPPRYRYGAKHVPWWWQRHH